MTRGIPKQSDLAKASLRVEGLEERIAPASATEPSTNYLLLTLAANEQITAAITTTTNSQRYRFTVSGGTWTTSVTDTSRSSGNTILNVTNNGVARFTTIEVRGTSGGNSITFGASVGGQNWEPANFNINFTAPAGTAVTNTDDDNDFDGNLTITITGGAGDVALTNDDFDISGNFTVSSNGGSITQTAGGRLTVGGTTSLSSGAGVITLNQSTNSFSGILTATSTADITLRDTAGLVLNGVTTTGNLTITTDNGLSQIGPVTVGGTSDFTNRINGGITLTHANNNFTGAVSMDTNVGSAQVTDVNAIVLGTVVSANDLIVTAVGITQNAGGITVTGNSTFSSGAGVITLTTAANSFTGSVTMTNTGNNAVSLVGTNSIILGNVSMNGTAALNVTASTGNITQFGGTTIVNSSTGTATFTASAASADITLDQANSLRSTVTFGGVNLRDVYYRNVFASPAYPLFAGGTRRNLGIVFNNAPIALGATTITGDLTVTAGGAITQTGALLVPGSAAFTTGSAAITLTNAGNDFGGVVTASNSGANAIQIRDTNQLNIGTISTANNLTLTAGAGLLQATGGVTAAGLNLQGTGRFDLSLFANDVDTIAANVTGSVNFRDIDDLDVATVGATAGITTNNGGFVVLNGTLITVNASINTNTGSGGVLTVGPNVSVFVAPTVGGGNITLDSPNVVAVGPETRVNQVTTASQLESAVAADGNGNYVVVWADNRSGNFDIWGRRYNVNGIAIANEFQISNLGYDERTPAVSMDDAGNFIVTWRVDRYSNTQGLPSGGTNRDLIAARRYDSNGNSVGNSFNGTATSGTANSLTQTGAGWITNQWAGMIVVITGGTGVGQVRTITSNTGTTLTLGLTWTTTPNNTSVYSILPIYGIGNGGAFATEWNSVPTVAVNQTQNGTNSTSGTANGGSASTLTVTGAPWTASQWVGYSVYITNGTGVGGIGLITANTTNTLTVNQWVSTASAGAASANPASGDTFVIGPTQYSAYFYNVAGNGVGVLARFWQGITNQPMAMVAMGPEFLPYSSANGSNTGVQANSSAAMNADGSRVIPTWETEHLDTGNRDFAIFTKVFDPRVRYTGTSASPGAGGSPTVITQDFPVFNDSNDTFQRFPSVSMDTSNNQIVYAWQSNEDGTYGIYERRYELITNTFLTPATKINQTAGDAILPQVSLDADGDYAIVWEMRQARNTGNVTGGSAGTEGTLTMITSNSWTVNQWANMMVRITGGPGVGQIRTIVSNTATTLTVSVPWDVDVGTTNPVNGSTYEIFSSNTIDVRQFNRGVDQGKSTGSNTSTTLNDTNQNWTTNGWAGLPVRITSGTGAGQVRTVSSNTATRLTVSVAWSVTPDASSRYQILVGVGEIDNGTVNSSTANTLTDSTKNGFWTTNQFRGLTVRILAGQGAGQIRTITANTTAGVLTVSSNWTVNPNSSSLYEIIFATSDGGTATSAGGSTLTDSTKAWTANQWQNLPVTIIAGTGIGQVRTISSNTATQLTVGSAWTTTPDNTSQYLILSSIGDGGIATDANTGSLTDSSKSWTTNQFANLYYVLIVAGTGTGQTRLILANTSTRLTVAPWTITPDTTSYYQIFRYGSTLPFTGDQIVNTTTTGNQVRPAIAMNRGANANRDFIVTWDGTVPGDTQGIGKQQFRRAPVPSAEQIVNTFTYGRQYLPAVAADASGNYTVLWQANDFETGTATGGSVVRLTDASKTWTANQWAGYTLLIVAGTGAGQARTIGSNDATQLFPTTAFTIAPNATSVYQIIDAADGTSTGANTALTLNDTTKNWVPSFWVGSSVQIVAGTGMGQVAGITGNSSTKLDIAGWFSYNPVVIPDATSVYEIVGSRYDIYAQRFNSAGTAISSEFRVNTTRTGTQRYASAAMDAYGNLVVAWASNHLGAYNIYTKLYDSAGAERIGEIQINTTAITFDRPSTSVAFNSGDTGTATGGTATSVVDTTKNWATNAWVGNIVIITGGAAAGRVGTITANSSTTLTISWISGSGTPAAGSTYYINQDIMFTWSGNDSNLAGIRARRAHIETLTFTYAGIDPADFLVNTTAAGNAILPSVAMDADGDTVVAWTNDYDLSGYLATGDVRFRLYNGQGTAVTGETSIAAPAAGIIQAAATAAMSADGNIAFSWSQYDWNMPDNGFDVYGRRFDSAGTAYGAAEIVNTTLKGDQVVSVIQADADGDYVIMWMSFDNGQYDIYVRRYQASTGATARPYAREVLVNTFSTSTQAVPSIGMDPDGDYIVAWASAQTKPDASDYGIFSRRYTAVAAASFLVGIANPNVAQEIHLDEAHAIAQTNARVVIADIDTGVNYLHPDLYDMIWINQGEIPAAVLALLQDTDGDGWISFHDLNHAPNAGIVADTNANNVIDAADILAAWSDANDDDGNGFIDDLVGWDFVDNDNDPMDTHGHGTHLAGILSGVAPDSFIMPIRFMHDRGAGYVHEAAMSITYASDNGARIATGSWSANPSDELAAALQSAAAQGLIFVGAAGNGDQESLGNLAGVHFTNVVIVAATDGANLADFSNVDPHIVDIAAPGTGITSTGLGASYDVRSGTSASAAFIAGALGLMLGDHPSISNSEALDDLFTSANKGAAYLAGTTHGALDLHAAVLALTPQILSITTNAPDGTYGTGAHIPVVVTFSKPVESAGNLVIELNSGGVIILDPFNGSTATGVYVVAPGETSAHLDVSNIKPAQSSPAVVDSVNTSASLSLPAGQSLGNNANITIEAAQPGVVIVQSAGQSSPTHDLAIRFTVTFSESVTGFDASDIVIGGSAGVTQASVTGSGATYEVLVSGMVRNGTVSISIAEGAALDSLNNPSLAAGSPNVTFKRDAIIVVGADAGAAPTVVVHDAETMAERFRFNAFDAGFLGGVRVAAGDVNGDGVQDIIAAAGPGAGPHLKVFDGQTGQLIVSTYVFDPGFNNGLMVATGDFVGDNLAVIVFAADTGNYPHVKIFRGSNGSEMASFFAYDEGFRGGVRLAVGDVDGDGHDDIVTGVGPGGSSHVKVFSGVDLSLIRSFFAFDQGFLGGTFVAAGDVDGDSFADIIVGAGENAGPHVKVISGANLSTLASFFAFEQSFGGGVRVGTTHANADNIAELILGAGPQGNSRVRIIDPTNPTQLDEFFAFGTDFTAGVYAAGK